MSPFFLKVAFLICFIWGCPCFLNNTLDKVDSPPFHNIWFGKTLGFLIIWCATLNYAWYNIYYIISIFTIYISLWRLIKKFMVLHGITSQGSNNFQLFLLGVITGNYCCPVTSLLSELNLTIWWKPLKLSISFHKVWILLIY